MDFSVFERSDHGGAVPDGLTVDVTDTFCRMRGTDHSPPRCAALTGTLGKRAACGIALPGICGRLGGLRAGTHAARPGAIPGVNIAAALGGPSHDPGFALTPGGLLVFSRP